MFLTTWPQRFMRNSRAMRQNGVDAWVSWFLTHLYPYPHPFTRSLQWRRWICWLSNFIAVAQKAAACRMCIHILALALRSEQIFLHGKAFHLLSLEVGRFCHMFGNAATHHFFAYLMFAIINPRPDGPPERKFPEGVIETCHQLSLARAPDSQTFTF